MFIAFQLLLLKQKVPLDVKIMEGRCILPIYHFGHSCAELDKADLSMKVLHTNK